MRSAARGMSVTGILWLCFVFQDVDVASASPGVKAAPAAPIASTAPTAPTTVALAGHGLGRGAGHDPRSQPQHEAADLPLPTLDFGDERSNTSSEHPELPSLHPRVVLRDVSGQPVQISGQAVSPEVTCDGCHDVAWILGHSSHALSSTPAQLFEEQRSFGTPSCFFCHLPKADRAAWFDAQKMNGERAFANTALLQSMGIVRKSAAGVWNWAPGAFAPDQTVDSRRFEIRPPDMATCGACHATVYLGDEPFRFDVSAEPSSRGALGLSALTSRTGVVFSDQRISASSLNIENKTSLTRPWDVHTERLLECRQCHFSPNHPAYAHRASASVAFEPRRIELGEYLARPDHRLARGPDAVAANDRRGDDRTSEEDASHPADERSTMRRCENCHRAEETHGWLPRMERHLSKLACESCHIDRLFVPTQAEVDWTVPARPDEPTVRYRGIDEPGSEASRLRQSSTPMPAPAPAPEANPMLADALFTGYVPVLLSGPKMRPYNLITTWMWVAPSPNGKPTPLDRATLSRIFFLEDGRYRPEILAALDLNKDGALDVDERSLNTRERFEAVSQILSRAGISSPHIEGRIEPVAVHHGVGPARMASRTCATCHASDSRVVKPMTLSVHPPYDATIASAGSGLPGIISKDDRGALVFQPEDVRLGVHVFGLSAEPLVDPLGLFLVVATILAAALHGALRILSARRQQRRRTLPRGMNV
ncbi:MAG: hypothetical protein H6729_04490 [Deltaproteobacteria bacterium]|nr:hypothetical protein [Deltaproteobacteria bacterium]